MPETWYDIAADARKAANRLVAEHYRSCLSRAYYAVYSKITHDLAGIPGVVFPAGDEGPKHPGRAGTGGIHKLIRASMTHFDEEKRAKLAELVGRLYTLRCIADYHPSYEVDARDAREAVSVMNTVFSSF